MSIITAILKSTLGSYEAFRLENTIIRYFYWTSPTKNNLELYEPEDSLEAKKAVLKSVATRGKYWYNFHEFLLAQLLAKCCCCLRNLEFYKSRQLRLKRHLDATKSFESELDIINVIHNQRLTQFLTKLRLRSA